MQQFALIDTHAHVQFSAYASDRVGVIARARDAGIGLINVGTQFSTSLGAVRLARDYPGTMWAAVGFHPGHTDPEDHHDPMEFIEKQSEEFNPSKFLELARYPEVVAIGECGLDYYRADRGQGIADSVKNRQKEVFSRQINIAKSVEKPLVIHCRSAFTDMIDILMEHRLSIRSAGNGVVHFFSGSWDDARKLINLGFFLGFGGVVTFARDYDEVVRNAPLDHLLLETDAPYVAPLPYRGKRNEPAYIVETARKIAELRSESPERIATATTENARKLFGI